MIVRMILEFEGPDGLSEDAVEASLNQCVSINTSPDLRFTWMDTDFEHDIQPGDTLAAQTDEYEREERQRLVTVSTCGRCGGEYPGEDCPKCYPSQQDGAS